MTRYSLTKDQVQLLRVVAEGGGVWDARRIDITFSSRYGAAETTILRQLEELKGLGLLAQDTDSRGVGGRWAVTSEAKTYVEGC